MFGNRLIKSNNAGAACTTDTVQILDGSPLESIATYQLNNATTSIPGTGYIDNGGVFNGSSSGVNLPSSLNTNVIDATGAFSISMWINANDISTVQYLFCSNTSNNVDLGINSNGQGVGKIVWTIYNTSYSYLVSTTTITTNTWYNIVVTYNNGLSELFINGASQGTVTKTLLESSIEPTLGYRNTGGSVRFNGKIDQFRVFNKALSQGEVTTLYGETSASSTKSTTDIFSDGSGIALYELESNANDTGGTYNGTATNVTFDYDGAWYGTPSYATGVFGQAASFNGTNNGINLPSISNVKSINLWVNMNSLPSGESQIYFADDASQQISLTYFSTNNSFLLYVYTGTGAFITPFTPSINTWYMLSVVTNPTNTYLYVNGQYYGSVGFAVSNFTPTQHSIGYYSVTGRYLNGSIDQVRIFNTALSAGAVTSLYNETVATASNSYINLPSCVAYYKMSDATDETGSYDGTPTNVNFNVAGKFGNAGEFNGSSSKILPSSSPIPSSGAFTVSAWVKTSISNHCFISFGDFWLKSEYLSGVFSLGDINTSFQGTTDISDGNWHHCVLTVDASNNIVLYVDGVSEDTGTATISRTNGGSFVIGVARNSNPVYYWNGSIDQVRIFNRAITSNEVETLYNEVECIPTIVPTDYFNPVIYTGDGTNGGNTKNITSVGFQPDLVWVKNRDVAVNHYLYDSVRGTGAAKALHSNTSNGEASASTYSINGGVSAFLSNGFTAYRGTDNTYQGTNMNGQDYVAWNWKAPLANLSTGFNGSSSYISSTQPLDLSTDNFTYSFWIYPTTNTGYGAPLSQYGGTTANRNFYSYRTGSTEKITFGLVSTGAGFNQLISTGTTPLNQWSHVALVRDSSTQKIYLNGQLSGTLSNTSTTSTSSEPFLIGDTNDTAPDEFFEGKLEQVRIFNTALSALKVSDLYAEPAASNNTLNYPAGAGCIAAYPLQTDAVDLSGNYNGASSNVTFNQPGYLTQNTEGTITSTVAANVDAGFSIVSYTGNGLSNQTIGHGLGKTPDMIITKGLANLSTYDNWDVWHKDLTLNYILALQSTSAEVFAGVDQRFVTSLNSDAVFGLGPDVYGPNSNGTTKIAYAFHSVDGYSKIGSYVGTGTAGNSIVTGFRPAFVMVKRKDSTGAWLILDNVRNTTNPRDKFLMADSNAIEGTADGIIFSSNGFTFTNVHYNNSGATFIFLAFAEEVFNPNGVTRNASDPFGDSSEVAFYKFEDDATDSTGSNDGTWSGTETYGTGYIDKAAVFNGVNQTYVKPPSGVDTILNTKNFGLSFWIKAPNANTDAAFSTETTNSTFQIHANWTIANRYALINGGGSNIDLGPIDSSWHHIVVTSDGSSSYKGYFDGVYKGAIPYRQTSNVGTFLGAHPAGGFNLLGEIDQVRIFNRALDSGEVTQLYNE